jgi:RHS repeat-associated protein
VFEYDKNGNLTRKTQNGTDITTHTFDYENRLRRIDYPDQTYSEYKYDPSGRRIQVRLRDGNIRRYYYDRHDLLAAYDESNNFLAAGVYGPGIDQAVSVFRRDGNNYYYHSDALGSIYQMTNWAQDIVKNYDYSAFGKIISESGSLPFDNPITYTGREYDDSGLYYYRARYYDAEIGRFLSRDPYEAERNPNLYIYVQNNPQRYRDPSGKLGEDCCKEKMEVSACAYYECLQGYNCPGNGSSIQGDCELCCEQKYQECLIAAGDSVGAGVCLTYKGGCIAYCISGDVGCEFHFGP